jgi:hypothetical protein
VNEAPTAVTLLNVTSSLPENTNTANAIKVADISITDDAIGTNTISLTGADSAAFIISGTSLYLKSGTSLNFEAKSSYSATVIVKDSTIVGSSTVSVGYSLAVTNVNEVPIFGQSNYLFLLNNKALKGSVVGLTSANDPDAGTVLTYSILSGNGTAAFAINPATGLLSVNDATKLPKIVAPATSVDAPQLVVQVSDGTNTTTATVTVRLQLAPLAMVPIAAAKVVSYNVSENNAVGASAASLSASPAYTGQLFANWSVSDAPGGPASTQFFVKSFTTTGAVIGVTPRLNFEVRNTYVFYVTVSDSLDATKTVTTAVTLHVLDVNDPPRISLINGTAGLPTTPLTDPFSGAAKYTINEFTVAAAPNSPKNGDILFSLSSIDEDQGSSAIFALTGTGVTNPQPGIFIDKTGAFQFDASTRRVVVLDARKVDFETYKTGIALAFSVTDNGEPGPTGVQVSPAKPLTSKATVTILLNDANDPPTFAATSINLSKSENNAANASVVTIKATDGDPADAIVQPLIYSLISVLNGQGTNVTSQFAIDPTTGIVTVLTAKLFDFESTANKSFTLKVRATETTTGLNTTQSIIGDQTINLAIADVNEAPAAVFTPSAPATGLPSSGKTGSLTLHLSNLAVGTAIGSLVTSDPDILAAANSFGRDTIVVSVIDGSSLTAPALAYEPNSNPTLGGTLRIADLNTLATYVGHSFTVKFTVKDKAGATGALSFTLTLTINVLQ